jgi:hypothetical protein
MNLSVKYRGIRQIGQHSISVCINKEFVGDLMFVNEMSSKGELGD